MNRCAFIVVVTLAACPALFAAPQTRPATRPAPYLTAHHAPLDATDKLVSATAAYELHRIEFNGIREGSRVPANLYVPRNPQFKAPYPALLLQYGSGGNKNTNYIVAIGEIAVSRGLVVLTIDVPNRGERKGRDPRFSFLDANVLQNMGDYSRAADYLCSRKDVDPSRIGYVGISWGAITGLTYVAHDPRIKAVVSLVGGAHFLLAVPGEPSDMVKERVATVDPYYHLAQIAPRPLLLVNATRDQIMPGGMAKALQEAAPKEARKVWLDTDHFFTGTDRPRLCNWVIDFILDGINGRPTNRPAPDALFKQDANIGASSVPAPSPRSSRN